MLAHSTQRSIAVLVGALVLVAITALPAGAKQPAEGVGEFSRLMEQNGYRFASQAEAETALNASEIPIDVALHMLRSSGGSADAFLPLELVITQTETTVDAPLSKLEQFAFGGELLGAAATASTSCKTQTTKVDLKGGVSGLTVLWHQLSTNHCYNGTVIVGTPTASITSGRTSYGLGLGYRWTSGPSMASAGWVTYQTQYRFKEQGSYAVCPLGTPLCYGGSSPWIQHLKYYSGSSIASYGL